MTSYISEPFIKMYNLKMTNNNDDFNQLPRQFTVVILKIVTSIAKIA